eukprot:6022408-Amphidinium_carterae.1
MTGWLASRLASLAAGQIQFGGAQVGGKKGLAHGTRKAIEWLIKELPNLCARKFLALDSRRPVIIFSDAAELDGNLGLGGVIWDSDSKKYEFFESEVPVPVVRAWKRSGAEQLISQAETYAAVVCHCTWLPCLCGRK